MRDFSFIRFKDNLADALRVGNSPIASQIYYDNIQLLPNEAYTQITSYAGGISLQSDFTAEIVNCKGVKLLDITNNIFNNEVLDEEGNTQIVFEIININKDFYNEPVLFKFYDNYSSYYSNPVTITEEFKELTSYFEYKNYSDYQGIAYTNSQNYQSIRLKCYFYNSSDESEIEDYYQISRGNTISARVLYKNSEKYVFDYLDRFVYDRCNVMLQHEIVYIDGVKVTNKTSFESSELIDKSNLFEASFSVYKNYKDTKQYSYQLFEGLIIDEFEPSGLRTLLSMGDQFNIEFNIDVNKLEGNIYLYNASNGLIHTFTNEEITVSGQSVNANGLETYITENGEYYFLIDSGLFESSDFGIPFEGISNPDVWTLTIGNADYSNLDYSDDYFTD